MRTQMDHNFQFADQSFQGGDVRLWADHFNCHRFDRFLAIFDSNGFGFDDSTETSSTQMYTFIVKYVILQFKIEWKQENCLVVTEFQPIPGEFPSDIVWQYFNLVIQTQIFVDFVRISSE